MNEGQEASLIVAFNARFHTMALEQGKKVVVIATDGDDRHLLADEIFGDRANWALVEFKSWSEQGQKAEERKPKSRSLCRTLQTGSSQEEWHDRVHHAGYGEEDAGLAFNVYRAHFCRTLSAPAQSDEDFLAAFYSAKIGLPPDQADDYIRWLLDLDNEDDEDDDVDSGGRPLRLLIDTGTGKMLMEKFSSTRAASKWIREVEQQRSGHTPPSGPGKLPKP